MPLWQALRGCVMRVRTLLILCPLVVVSAAVLAWISFQTPKHRPAPGVSTVQCILLIGESNAGGYALNTELSAGELAPRAAVQILNNTSLEFEDLDIPTNNLMGHDGLTGLPTHGFEAGFANDAEVGLWGATPIYLVKAGQGASRLSMWEDADAYWLTAMERIDAAEDEFTTLGVTPKWSILISIGINDALFGTTAGDYETALRDYIDRLRDRLGDVPVALTLLMPDYAAYNVKQSLVASDTPRVFTLPMTNYSTRDSNHWDAAGFKLGATDFVNGLDSLGYLSMSTIFSDSLTGSAGTALESHTPEVGTGWAKNTSFGSSAFVLNGTGQARSNVAGFSLYHVIDQASQANQRITAVLKFATASAAFTTLRQRCATDDFGGYELFYNGGGTWVLRCGYGSFTTLDTLGDSISDGQSRTVNWRVVTGPSSVDHVITIEGVGTLEGSDSHADRITAIGRAGFWSNVLHTDSTGVQIDSFALSEVSGIVGVRTLSRKLHRPALVG